MTFVLRALLLFLFVLFVFPACDFRMSIPFPTNHRHNGQPAEIPTKSAMPFNPSVALRIRLRPKDRFLNTGHCRGWPGK